MTTHRPDEVLAWCDAGLLVDPTNAPIIAERAKHACGVWHEH